jgi:hypothetical protein
VTQCVSCGKTLNTALDTANELIIRTKNNDAPVRLILTARMLEDQRRDVNLCKQCVYEATGIRAFAPYPGER